MLGSVKARVLVILAAVGVAVAAIHQRGLTFGLDLERGKRLTPGLTDADKTAPEQKRDELVRRAERVVRTRLDEPIVEEPAIQRAGFDRLITELPGPNAGNRAYHLLKRTADIQVKLVQSPSAVDRAPPRMDRVLRGAQAPLATSSEGPEHGSSIDSWTTHGPTAGRPPPVR